MAQEELAPAHDVSSPIARAQKRPKMRQKFAAIDDVVLLRAVNAFRPWRAPAGTSNGVMKVFEAIAAHCAQKKEFGVKKSGPALRTRFNSLVFQYKADQCKSLRQSGTAEEFRERELLLDEIISQMDDWSEHLAREKQRKGAKIRALARSGEVQRRLAIDELESAADDDAEESSATDASAPSDSPTFAIPSNTLERRKLTKTDKVATVSDALMNMISTLNRDENRRYDFEIQKMQFKREEAELQRQHMREEAARQREHELVMENRRLQAEQERDRMMQEFVLKLLNYQRDAK